MHLRSRENEQQMTVEPESTAAKEILIFLDEQTWIWPFLQRILVKQPNEFLRLPSETPIRPSWERFKGAPRILIHWEAKHRSGGAIVEEILDVAPHFDTADRIVILSTNPTHEDVVYFSELGLRRIIHLRNVSTQLDISAAEILNHIGSPPKKGKTDRIWRKLIMTIDALPGNADPSIIDDLDSKLEDLKKADRDEASARYYDLKAILAFHRKDLIGAKKYWHLAIEKNPKYHRAYNGIVRYLKEVGEFEEAFAILQKMQELNKSSISRFVAMGELRVAVDDDERAEHYFKSALDRDEYSAGALNGLAEIRFRQGDLDESRKLLARSHQAEKTASKLNSLGIEMVKQRKYSQALEHYTKAQYVLPQQEKGPMLFYNIGLCYYRWGREDLAREFLKIALIKEPGYKKARSLLEAISDGAIPAD
jgi:pentatricopeptide repeat protein